MRGAQKAALSRSISAIATEEIVAPVIPSTCQGCSFLPCLTASIGLAGADRSAVRETSSFSKFFRNASSVSMRSPNPGVSLLASTRIPTIASSANE